VLKTYFQCYNLFLRIKCSSVFMRFFISFILCVTLQSSQLCVKYVWSGRCNTDKTRYITYYIYIDWLYHSSFYSICLMYLCFYFLSFFCFTIMLLLLLSCVFSIIIIFIQIDALTIIFILHFLASREDTFFLIVISISYIFIVCYTF